jgi:DNA-binding XRE family transcriptional regulator
MGYDLKTLHRLWSKVIIPKDYENDCWIWTGMPDRNGYGFIGVKGKNHRVHRFIYECYNGSIPDGLLICHSCDNPPCVSPYHLLPGTHQDNIDDAIERNRLAYGEKIGTAVLTDNDIKEILILLWENKFNCVQLSKKYGVEPTTINGIVVGRQWKHIYNQLTQEQKERIKTNVKNNIYTSTALVNEDDVKKMRNLYATTNITQKELGKMFNIHRTTVTNIINRYSWKHI